MGAQRPTSRTWSPTSGEFRPTFILAVPRVFEKVFNTASQRATADGRGEGSRPRRRCGHRVVACAGLATEGARSASAPEHALFDRLVYGKLRQALGGSCAYAISGGAPLGERLGHFYRGIGLVVLEGYGLTETTPPSPPTFPTRRKVGTVGPSATRHRASGSPTTASCSSAVAPACFAALLGQRGRDEQGARSRRLVPHRRRR